MRTSLGGVGWASYQGHFTTDENNYIVIIRLMSGGRGAQLRGPLLEIREVESNGSHYSRPCG